LEISSRLSKNGLVSLLGQELRYSRDFVRERLELPPNELYEWRWKVHRSVQQHYPGKIYPVSPYTEPDTPWRLEI
jgi:hypothetical protein